MHTVTCKGPKITVYAFRCRTSCHGQDMHLLQSARSAQDWRKRVSCLTRGGAGGQVLVAATKHYECISSSGSNQLDAWGCSGCGSSSLTGTTSGTAANVGQADFYVSLFGIRYTASVTAQSSPEMTVAMYGCARVACCNAVMH